MPLKQSISIEQECIPVGCVPSAAVAVWGGGVVCLLGGVCFFGGVCLLGGCLLLGGVPASWGCLLLGGGVCFLGAGIPACTEADTPPPCEQTDACKNITFATSLRTVIMTFRLPIDGACYK